MLAGIYRHHKGGHYMVLGVASDSSNGLVGRLAAGTQREMVVYVSLDAGNRPGSRMHVRERAEFMERLPDGRARFVFVGETFPDHEGAV